MFGPSSIYGLDIETDNSEGFGLDPRRGRVTEVAVAIDPSIDGVGGEVFNDSDEEKLFIQLNEYLSQLPTGLITTWNGSFFDLPFLSDRMGNYDGPFRSMEAGPALVADPQLVPKYEPLPGHAGGYSGVWFKYGEAIPHQHLDVSQAYKATAERLGVKWSLKPVCAALGIDMIEVDRENLHLLTPEERRAYCLSDGVGTRELALRILGLA